MQTCVRLLTFHAGLVGWLCHTLTHSMAGGTGTAFGGDLGVHLCALVRVWVNQLGGGWLVQHAVRAHRDGLCAARCVASAVRHADGTTTPSIMLLVTQHTRPPTPLTVVLMVMPCEMKALPHP